jgi:hypothetical protein
VVAYFLAIGGAFFLIVSIGAVAKSGFSGGTVLPMLGGLFLVLPLVLRILRSFLIEPDFHKHPGFAGAACMLVDAEGLKTEGGLERRETKWPAFTKYRETENLFILYEGPRFLRIFPKRALSTQELDDFRVLLASKITTSHSQAADKHL